VRRLFRPFFLSNYVLKIFYDVLGTFVTLVIINYAGFGFLVRRTHTHTHACSYLPPTALLMIASS
jgi:hypothetical protein